MELKQIRAGWKEGSFAPCYLLYGTEPYLLEEYEKRLKQPFEGSFGEMNLSIFERETPLNDVLDAAETLPFFAPKRLVLLRESGLFWAGRKNDTERMTAFLEQLPEQVCLAFRESQVDKRMKIFKTVQKVGQVMELKLPGERELIYWAVRQMKKRGVTLERATAAAFFQYVGDDMENSLQQLEKLASYVGEGKTVRQEDIAVICARSLEAKVFDLVGAVGERRTQDALRLYREMLMAKEAPLRLLALLARQIRLMLQCQLMLEAGMAQADLGTKLGQKPFTIRQCLRQGKNFTKEMLQTALSACAQTDWAIKSGQMKDDLAVELWIVETSR